MKAAKPPFIDRRVRVTNIDVARAGHLVIFVFGEHGFPKDHAKALRSYVVAPRAGDIELTVEAPRNGDFAIKVLHDEDMNGRVTKNWIGIVPREGLGFSGGATILCGAPHFRRSRVQDSGTAPIEIVMRYPGWLGI